MTPGDPFIWDQKVKGQGHESKNIAGVAVCTLVSSAGLFLLHRPSVLSSDLTLLVS